MPEVLLHNLTHPFRRCAPEIFNHDQMAVFMAEPGDVVVTRERIEPAYLDFLSSVGYDFSNIRFIHSDKRLPEFDSVFYDKELVRKIRASIGGEKRYRLDAYAPTSLEHEFSRAIGASFLEVPQHFERWGTKSGFRKLAKELDILIPYGFEDVDITDKTEFFRVLARLFRKGAFRIAFKPDEGAAGMDIVRLGPGGALQSFFHFERFSEAVSRRQLTPLRTRLFVAEEWKSGVIASPGIQLLIQGAEKVEVLSVYQQILEQNGATYCGCMSQKFLSEETIRNITTHSLKMAGFMAKKGFRGHLAFDAVLRKDGGIFFTDLNPRKVISLYPQLMRNRLVGSSGDRLHASLRLRSRSAPGMTIDELLSRLGPMLFRAGSGRGIVPYDYGLLRKAGMCRLLLVGENARDTAEQLKKLDEFFYTHDKVGEVLSNAG